MREKKTKGREEGQRRMKGRDGKKQMGREGWNGD